jgi:hypothetical protein
VCAVGSDGSQQEGNDAEAARLAVAYDLPVKVHCHPFVPDSFVGLFFCCRRTEISHACISRTEFTHKTNRERAPNK